MFDLQYIMEVNMNKFISWDFALLLIITAMLFVVHEFGHYLVYRVLGYEAIIRKSLIAPGIDPKYTIEVSRFKGILIAVGGFVLSTAIIVMPFMLFGYKHWFVLLIASIAGSIMDFIWAATMLLQKTITIYSR
jgi:hypothetical protein